MIKVRKPCLTECSEFRELSWALVNSLEPPTAKGLQSQQLKVSGGRSVMDRVTPAWSGREASLTLKTSKRYKNLLGSGYPDDHRNL